MIPYVLHVALLISICLLFYKIFLQRETFYKLNRVVLLICLGLSFMLPLISVPQGWTLRGTAETPTTVKTQQAPDMNAQIAAQVQQQVLTEQKKEQAKAVGKHIPVNHAQPVSAVQPTSRAAQQQPVQQVAQSQPIWPIVFKWLFYLYWAGVAAFGLNLLLQVIVLLYRAYSNPVILDGKFRIIEVSGDKAPCSFGNNIFINPEKYDWDTYNQILMHEKVHIQQGHSLDILLAELVLVFQWFNPFAWLYRGELENNLEFLTDEAVLDHNTVEKESYQMSLLKVSAPHLALSVTTNYNQSLLKKRIVMMNAKRSNIHTMWKYFILLPLMAGLACALNQTVAFSQAVKVKAKANASPKIKIHNQGHMATEGSWFATVKGEKVRIEFKSDDDDHNWSSNDSFLISEFSALPKDTKGDFTLKREAGTIFFNGKFEGDEGYGHYKFVADKSFTDYLKGEGISGIEENDEFAFFVINIKKDYVAMLKANGYGHIDKNELVSMGALKVDKPFIEFWKEEGYNHLSANDLVSAKALGISKEYVHEIREAGYKNLDFNQLVGFKAQGIDAKYIASFKKANLDMSKGKESNENNLPRAEDISSFKAMNIDSDYLHGLKEAGYTNVPLNELTSMKAVGVTPEYIKEMKAIGFKDIDANELVSMKSLDVTPEYVKGFEDAGYKDISANELVSAKSLGITPAYIKGFEAMGYKDISINELTGVKSLGITSEYIKSFEAIGYKQIPLNELTSLKALGVTPGFIKGFKDIGFEHVSLNDVTSLKAMGVTPQYIKEMKAKGFVSKDLNKYIELKSAFN